VGDGSCQHSIDRRKEVGCWLRERELSVPSGQGAKKVADQKAQLDAFPADAAAKRETAAPSGHHEPEPHLAEGRGLRTGVMRNREAAPMFPVVLAYDEPSNRESPGVLYYGTCFKVSTRGAGPVRRAVGDAP
jgi:hypothetical protein